MPETPLETARRLWPGEWVVGDKVWDRAMGCSGDGKPVTVRLRHTSDGEWNVITFAGMYPVGGGQRLATGGPTALEEVLATARDRVQSMARDFARAAGVEVVSEAPPL